MPNRNSCPYCQKSMSVTQMTCAGCQIAVEGTFPATRLGQLPMEHQRFIELLVLSGGSLKQMADQAGVSYPTIRSRLDKVIDALAAEVAQTSGPKRIEMAGLTGEEAARVIKAI